jgi:hypothetical protein
MRNLLPIVALALALVLALSASGCAWLTRGADDVEPEKLYSETPCTTECCCKTKSGYYSYFRCLEKPECQQAGGSCERPDTARCESTGS